MALRQFLGLKSPGLDDVEEAFYLPMVKKYFQTQAAVNNLNLTDWGS